MTQERLQKNIGNMGIAAIMLISSLTVMVGNAITPALPELGKVYGLGNYASWLVTAPALGVVATAILFGRLIDKKGPYWVALFGLLFYGLFGVCGAYMPNAAAIFIDRFLLGAATAAIMNASVALIATFFQGEKQLKVIAVQGMSMEFGGVIFLSISGVLADVSWRSPFYIYSLGFLALILLLIFIPRCGRAAAAAQAEEEGSAPAEKGVPLPLVLLIAFLGMLMFFTLMVSLPIHLQTKLGYSPSFTGYYLAALDLVAVLAAGFMPKIVSRFQPKGCLFAAFCFYGIAFLLYFLSGNAVVLWIAVFFAGIGFGFSTPLFNSLVVNKSTPENKGTNISFCTMAMFGGQFLSALLVSALAGTTLFLVAGLLALLIAACILPIVGRYHKKDREEKCEQYARNA
ncbi:MFS transporter [Anaerovorax odorimutans]|uniref:MFS transporter n=1 Tax=Anaerovorax odorimutans TaxID=109327 RepID=A0ABT1RNY1_9FIRM|nr:MFS transporter [Anaerovorax odorimutans]MCQ4636903.1 MFS transporter [Anaerovorax odorimutans]